MGGGAAWTREKEAGYRLFGHVKKEDQGGSITACHYREENKAEGAKSFRKRLGRVCPPIVGQHCKRRR